ncbi:ATP synthase subunit b [Iodidimonas muriae]|uniref:ATP synthase subunit b n=1 Tax=Iodidimonas muriae TaxID=261467 RepID=A0ABQ2LB04_9PROT|nr:hypothetical protein [Iodidimonas muriae]GER08071.1 ATP synthase subunit b [Kordiimonadales bacterium JCM 17843]GGO08951.1 ATP synthase subunit b [Iodidimonas muriae]
MPQFDPALFAPQIIWLIIAFGVLWLLMARVGLPRVERAMVERSEQIEADLDAARTMKAKADELTQEYEAALAQARAKAGAISERTKADIRERSEKLLSETQAKIDAEIAKAQQGIDQEVKAAMGEMDKMATDVAASLIARLIGEEVESAELEAAVATIRSEAA